MASYSPTSAKGTALEEVTLSLVEKGLAELAPLPSLGFYSQIFPRVMAPISTILHSLGIRMRRYLYDWLIPANSREEVLQTLSPVLSLCRELGVVGNPEKSNFVPDQRFQYLGMVIDAQTFRASPSRERINKRYVSRRQISVLQAAARVHLADSSGDCPLSSI